MPYLTTAVLNFPIYKWPNLGLNAVVVAFGEVTIFLEHLGDYNEKT